MTLGSASEILCSCCGTKQPVGQMGTKLARCCVLLLHPAPSSSLPSQRTRAGNLPKTSSQRRHMVLTRREGVLTRQTEEKEKADLRSPARRCASGWRTRAGRTQEPLSVPFRAATGRPAGDTTSPTRSGLSQVSQRYIGQEHSPF